MVKQLRTVLNVADDAAYARALAFYRDGLGLPELAAYTGPDGAEVVILDAGRATLELANPAQGRFIAEVETGGVASSPVRLAFEVDDAAAATAALTAAGAELVAAPVRTPWDSRNGRVVGPEGLHVTLFQELHAVERAGLVGETVEALGGEAGVLARAVELATANARAGQLPFAALVVRDGVVVGTGVNTALADHDPTAHAEVAAVRDAARRAGSPTIGGAVVYSSCEPCAMCRTTAVAARAREIVYAAGYELVLPEIAGDAETTRRLGEAVAGVLPRLVRKGESGLSQTELAAPFAAYVAATSA